MKQLEEQTEEVDKIESYVFDRDDYTEHEIGHESQRQRNVIYVAFVAICD